MMYELWDGSSAPWYGMIFGPIVMIAFVAIALMMVAWVLRACGLGWRSAQQDEHTPVDTLKHHFARDEIDRANYKDRKKLLLG